MAQRTLIDWFRYLLVTGFGLGLAPVASGTFGTLGGIVLAVALQLVFSGSTLAMALMLLAVLLFAFGCSLTDFSARTFRFEDPKPFVLDEIVGYLLALSAYVAVGGEPTALAHGSCFFFFRVFDVLKLYPANRFEAIPGAPGIMLDDAMAGIYTALVLVGLHWTRALG